MEAYVHGVSTRKVDDLADAEVHRLDFHYLVGTASNPAVPTTKAPNAALSGSEVRRLAAEFA